MVYCATPIAIWLTSRQLYGTSCIENLIRYSTKTIWAFKQGTLALPWSFLIATLPVATALIVSLFYPEGRNWEWGWSAATTAPIDLLETEFGTLVPIYSHPIIVTLVAIVTQTCFYITAAITISIFTVFVNNPKVPTVAGILLFALTVIGFNLRHLLLRI